MIALELADFALAEVEAELKPDGIVFSLFGIVVGVLETDVGEKLLVFKLTGEGDGEAVAGSGCEGILDFAHVDFGTG